MKAISLRSSKEPNKSDQKKSEGIDERRVIENGETSVENEVEKNKEKAESERESKVEYP